MESLESQAVSTIKEFALAVMKAGGFQDFESLDRVRSAVQVLDEAVKCWEAAKPANEST